MTREHEIWDRLDAINEILREASNAYHRVADPLMKEKEALIREWDDCRFKAATEASPPPESSGDEWSKFGF